MKRDWNLIKALMIELENCEPGHFFAPQPLAGHDLKSVRYHLHLLHQAGLAECEMDEPWNGDPTLVGCNLTLLGHDMLDSLRAGEVSQPRPLHFPFLEQLANVARESLRRMA